MHNQATRDEVQKKICSVLAQLQFPEFANQIIDKLHTCLSYLLHHTASNSNIGVSEFRFGGTYSYALTVHQPLVKAAIVYYGKAPQPVDQIQEITCPLLVFTSENDSDLIKDLPLITQKMKTYKNHFPQ